MPPIVATSPTTQSALETAPASPKQAIAYAAEPAHGAVSNQSPQQQLTENYFPQKEVISGSPATLEALKKGLIDVKSGRIQQALNVHASLPDTLDRRILEWQLMVNGGPSVPIALITEFAGKAPYWPSPEIARTRAEASLAAANLRPQQVISAFAGSQPESFSGKIALAKAYVTTGQNTKARELIAPIWKTNPLEKQETGFLRNFGRVLTQEDHRLRAEMLLYRDRTRAAERLLPHLTHNHQRYMKARIASIRKAKNAEKQLAAVPRSMQSEPGYLFALIKRARSRSDYLSAAKYLDQAPTNPDKLVNPDEWWVQRRVVSRMLLEKGEAKRAYSIAANHSAQSAGSYTEAEWHAGWYALRFLNNPQVAEKHFKNITKRAKTPITLSKAYYWIGRSREATGDVNGAISAYRSAGKFGTAFYGQLALAKLSETSIPLVVHTKPSAAEKVQFEQNELVQAIRRMDAAGFHQETLLLYKHLAEKLNSNSQIQLLTQLAEEKGRYNWSLMIGKLAYAKRLSANSLAYPTSAIPSKTVITDGVEKPMVYAIARQESAFDPKAKSSAGALGLLQLMPGTARETAKSIGVTYQKSKLTNDPAYNATLGAKHLDELIAKFNGSYILTFAAYNAGKGKVEEWIRRFGDPRDPKVDPIDWIEMIPYGETRSYVQRITENLQVYRHKLQQKPLTIVEDITRVSS
ncbi:lytic transglycosylase domain-containing protein [Flexibacterium corallicola]|uniref:lytic transglycosylase domain-containing protein n=1 Tax=Flexibacterium corallicola TaxID=3037259 RepID=UPI00286F6E36|nr:lytic transglycosylase domain-containing protein [Pseudovibrio sp. M1P-2-3]